LRRFDFSLARERDVKTSLVRSTRLAVASFGGASALGLAALMAPAARGAENLGGATVAIADDSSSTAQLCVGHGRDCACAGCRAFYNACEIPCPPGMAPSITPEMLQEGMTPEGAAPQAEAAEAEPEFSGPMSPMTSSLAALGSAPSAAEGMIGDFFGGGYQYAPGAVSPGVGPTVAIAGGDRILKFADNNSPIPQDRLFFNYHLFANPVTDINGQFQDVNRFTFGLEKTFWDGTTSIEFRVPFEAGLDNVQSAQQPGSTLAAEFGNLALATKLLLYQRGGCSVAGGLGMIFPTAADSVVLDQSGEEISRFANESIFLQPFLGAFIRPTRDLWTQVVTQVNFDVSGSTVSYFGESDVVYEQALLFIDWSTGYWLYRTNHHDAILTGIAPMIELHYATTMEDLDLPEFSDGSSDIFVEDFRRDALNITGGVLFGLGQLTSLRVAGVAPLRDETLMYDAEFGVQLIRRY
jgi:hypothetical protein